MKGQPTVVRVVEDDSLTFEEMAVDLVENILLDILHITVMCRGNQGGLVVVPLEDMLLAAFEGVVPSDLLRQCAQQLLASSDGTGNIDGESLRRLVDQIDRRVGRDSSVESKLAAAHQGLEDLLGLCLAKATEYVTGFQIYVTRPSIFNYIQRIQPPHGRGQAITTIIARILRSVEINFGESDPFLSRIAMRYTNMPRWPLLTVYQRSFSQIDAMRASRQDWPQATDEEYDLQYAKTGRIFTRLVQLPCNIQVGRGSLRISEQANVDVISTKIVSPGGTLLAECIRVAHHDQGVAG